jgi:hypothetical protein
MNWQRICTALLAGAALTASARAQDCCAPPMRTVCVTEWVKENYVTTRTVYRTECVQEKYTAYRTECVPQVQTRTYTVSRMVPEFREEVRTVCVPVSTVETRTVMKPVVTCRPVTTVTRKCVDMGHYECREVPCRQSCLAKLRHCCGCDCCEPCPPPMKTVKVWVPCKVWVETPCTKMVRTCEYVPTPIQVTVCRMVPQQQTVRVCCYRAVCEQKTETCTVMVSRCVPCEATRTVARCVPVQEQVTLCRMVPHVVQKQVPCCETCVPCCCKPKKCCR